MVMTVAPSLIVTAYCGLPLALACRRLWWLRIRRTCLGVGAGLGTVTVAASILAGMLGSLAIVVAAAVFSLPVWIADGGGHADLCQRQRVADINHHSTADCF